jgi:hypothetical protein
MSILAGGILALFSGHSVLYEMNPSNSKLSADLMTCSFMIAGGSWTSFVNLVYLTASLPLAKYASFKTTPALVIVLDLSPGNSTSMTSISFGTSDAWRILKIIVISNTLILMVEGFVKT